MGSKTDLSAPGVALQSGDGEPGITRRLQHGDGVLEKVANQAGIMMAAIDKDLECVFVNRAYRKEIKRLSGRTPRPGCHLRDLLPADPSPRRLLAKLWRRALRGKATGRAISTRDALGSRRTYNVRFVPIRDAQGKVIGAGEMALDITEQAEAEERFCVAQELSLDGFAIMDAVRDDNGTIIDFRFRYLNPAGRKLWRIAEDSSGDQRLLALLPWAKTATDLFERLARVVETGQSHALELCYRADNLNAWFRTMCVRLDDGVAVCFSDISSRKQAEEELRRAKAAAEEATVAKSQFLAAMSHEVRTPMNAILGMTHLALSEKLSPSAREYLQTVQDSAQSLLLILNEILDFSRIEARQLALESIAFSPQQVTQQVVKTLAAGAQEKGLQLRADVSGLPPVVTGDPLRLRQVLLNLVGNAIKFTTRGTISIRGEVERRTTETMVLRYCVADTGKGIRPDEMEKIFSPFTQADASTTRCYGGTGLGLAISRQLTALMGGRIWAESELGRGSRFYFTVSLRIASPEDNDAGIARPADRDALRDMRVLVVSQHATRRRNLQETLAAWQMWTETNGSAPGAIARIQDAAAAATPFHLVLADVGMTGADGFVLAEWLKSHAKLAGPVILLLSPNDRLKQVERCKALGVSYVEKPLSTPALLAAVAAALKLELLLLSSRKQPVLPSRSRALHVLLAEDTPANQKLMQHLLKSRGHSVHLAVTGREVLQSVDKHIFDVILMDVQMPEMDGFQATAAIRRLKDPIKANVPIVAMTACAMKGDRERCLAAGMDCYFSKPFDCRQVLAAIERLADQNNCGDDAHSTLNLPTADNDGDLTGTDAAHAEEHFHLHEALDRCLGKYELFQEIVSCFFDEVDRLIEEIRSAHSDGNAEKLGKTAHRLKGTLVLLCAHPARAAAQELEQMGLRGDLKPANLVIEDLMAHIALLKQALVSHRP